MGFQPFGYRFEVSSTLPPLEAKAAVRAKKTTIFDANNGARGWIVGPFICLWFSAFDRHGPMLFGLISADNFGTRMRGRAGSDLNGIAMFTLLIPLMAWLVVKMVSEGQASSRQLLVIALVFSVGGPLIYWLAHKGRKDAEPLERFLRKTLNQSEPRCNSMMETSKAQEGMRLILNGNCLEGPVTEEAIQSAFMRVGNHDFLIIESGPEEYLQTASRDGGYILEIRKGGPTEHYRIIRNRGAVGRLAKADHILTYEEVDSAMASYISGDSLPNLLQLQPMDPHQ